MVGIMNKYDVVVLGGGPGGYVAAIYLAKAGLNICLIERDRLGGTCLNHGCIPTKALYHYAKTVHSINKHQLQGISTGQIELDFDLIMNNKQETVDSLVSGVEILVKKNKITLIEGEGKFVDDSSIIVQCSNGETKQVSGEYIVVATGSKPILPPITGLKEGMDNNFVLTSKEALALIKIPNKIVVIGGGVIGMEFATIFNQFGSEVTVIEATESILPSFNKELIKRFKPLVKKQGLNILTKSMVTAIDKTLKTVTYEGKNGPESIDCDIVLCAVGRKPSFNHISLNNLSNEIDDTRKIIVDDFMRTSINNLYAIGDVNGLSLLAHSASKQGVIAAKDIINKFSESNREINSITKVKGFSSYSVPQVAFLLPEISQVVSNDYDASKKYKSGKFLYRSNGMALAIKESDGLCKVEYDEDMKRLVYMGILGETGAELIHTGVHGIDHELNFNDLTDSIAGHPSLMEILHETLLDINKMGIHQI